VSCGSPWDRWEPAHTMPRRAAVRKIDIDRTLAALKDAGVEIARVELDPVTGKVVIIPKDGAAAPIANPLDAWRAKRARDAG
jgi:hypothetical protein